LFLLIAARAIIGSSLQPAPQGSKDSLPPNSRISSSKYEIVLGETARLGSLEPAIDLPKLGKEGFTIRTVGSRLVIAANSGRGAVYGVYAFLEENLGCRWFTSDCSLIPKRNKIELSSIDNTEMPILEFREVYYADSMDPVFAGRLKLNGNASRMKGGRMVAERHAGWGTWCHTSFSFVPPETYFKDHPEYYSLVDGKRKARQLCFSNPDVLEIAVRRIQKLIEQPIEFTPGSNEFSPRKDGPIWADDEDRYFDVSQQDDADGACQCAECKRIDEQGGSHIGSILEFINKLAARFPDKTISTLSYQYTRTPPRHIRPGSNVAIMLSNIECTRGMPMMDSPFPEDKAFKADLQRWSAICSNLFVWDYAVNFENLLMPNPNLHVQQPNIKFFVEHNAKGIFTQGSREVGGEFCGLRNYLLAKLLWNPDCNVDALMNEYLGAYYGPAGPLIRQYVDLMTKTVVAAKEKISAYDRPEPHARGYLSEAMMEQYRAIFDRAEELVRDNETTLMRVRTARMPVLYVQILNKYGTPTDRMEALNEFLQLCKENGIRRLSEWGNSPGAFEKAQQAAWSKDFSVIMKPAGGFFCQFSNLTVSMSAKANGGVVRYTLDGTEPTEASALYSEPVKITAETVIKAGCIVDGKKLGTATGHFKKAVLPIRTEVMGKDDDAVYMKVPVRGAIQLTLKVDDVDGSNSNDHADWADAKLIDRSGHATYLSALKPVRAVQGWGELGLDKSVTGKTLAIGPATFARGLGTHAVSEIVYRIDRQYEFFETYVGVDGAANRAASVRFLVEAE
jgi:hypothetical protein